MARAFNVASRRISAERVKRQLDDRFVGSETEYTAAGFGSGAVYIDGHVYNSNEVGVGVVTNVGRPAAAFYASAAGGGGSVIVSGGGSTGGGGAVSGDFLLRSGILPMTGNLDMGNRSIVNVALVDGRDLELDGVAVDSLKNASYLVVAVDPVLTNERNVAFSSAFAINDGGAGNPYSIALTTPGSLSATSTNLATGNHTHEVTASDNPGAAVSLLKSAADGSLSLTKLTTPLITTSTNVDLLIDPAGTGGVKFTNSQTLRTSTFDSSFPIQGWQINEVVGVAGYSALTIGKIQADELAVRVFVADEVRVDRGDEFWTKSYGIVAETFTSPGSIGGTVSVKFEDSPALAGAIFTNNDWVLIRKLEISTGITLFNLWGQVTTYVNNADGTQNWTFTLRNGPLSQSITKGSLAIDFGASGAALIHLSVIDAAGAPYIKMRRWAGANPYTPANFTTYVQIGNLGSVGNPYYTPSGDGLYIRSTAADDQFMVADNNGFQIRGASFSLYNGANQTILMNNAAGLNFDEDLWGSWDNRRAMQWWPDVASMTGEPSLSIFTGKVSGGFADQQNFSYIDAKPTGGVLAALFATAYGQGTAHDAILTLEGGSQSLATGSTASMIADTIDLVGTTTFTGTGQARNFNPQADLTYNLGTTLLRWNILYVDQIIVSGAISGSTLSGQEWEYLGSMVIDANSASNTTVTVVNQGAGTVTLDVEGNITLAGTVDGVDVSLFKAGYDSHVGNVNAHHSQSHVLASTSALGADHSVSGLSLGLVLRATSATTAAFTQLLHTEIDAASMTTGDPHTQYLLRSGGTLTGNVAANVGVTIDGVDLSVHVADINAHHAMQHDITSAAVHIITSATLGLVGATATNTLGVITPSANPGAAAAVLRSDNVGVLTLVQLNATTKLQTPLIDTLAGNLTLAPVGGTVAITGTGSASVSLLTPALNTASGNLALGAVGGQVRLQPPTALQTDNYASQLTGWRMTYDGDLDARNIYTDQLHAKAFIADLEQALAGGQIISKSVAVLASDFVVPYAGGLQLLTVKDLPSAANMAVFQDGDIVRLRTFNRAGGGLTIGDCWGSVSGYTDNPNGTQTWSFLRSGLTTYTGIAIVGTATFATSAAATSRVVNKPTGVAQNDVLLAVVTHDGAADVVTASGWSLLQYVSGSDIHAGIYYKIAGASEPSNYTFSTVGSHAIGASIVAYRNVYLSAPIDGYSIQANAAGAAMPAPAVWSTSTQGRAVFLGGITNNSAAAPPSSYTELVDSGATGIRVYVAEKQLIANGSTGIPSATISASFASVAAQVVLRPAFTFMWAEAGGLAPSTVINADSLVLDYGMSGNGFHEVNAIDGIYGANSPYAQTVTWASHPATGQTVRTRTGNLFGLFGVTNEYGFYAGNGTTNSNSYIRLSSNTADLNNIPLSMHDSGIKRVEFLATAGMSLRADTSTTLFSQQINWFRDLNAKSETPAGTVDCYTIGNINYLRLWAWTPGGINDGASVEIFANGATGFTTPRLRLTDIDGAASMIEMIATTITVTGNVGIGVTPSATLDVARGTAGGGTCSFRGTTHTSHFNYSTTEDTYLRGGKTGSVVYMNDTHAGNVVMAGGGGSVGVGVAPSFKLDVAGACHASSFPTSSDARLKVKVEPVVGVLSQLSQIGAYRFQWSENYHAYDQYMDAQGNPRTQIGVLAQEVQARFPELVSTWRHTGKDGMAIDDALAVDYVRIVPLLLAALRELRTEVNELRMMVADFTGDY